MASTPGTGGIGVELQAAGENLNTWGDPKLNNTLQVLLNLGAKWNPITINGDTTISETNYSTSNDSEVATIKLTTGTVAAAFNVVLPSRNKRILFWNATSYAATIKLSASSGFSLPASRVALVGTDGSTDVYNLSPNYVGTGYTPSNSGDVANKLYVDNAIATASLPATAGTVLVSGADTTAGYIGTKLVASGDITLTDSGAGNATLTLAVNVKKRALAMAMALGV